MSKPKYVMGVDFGGTRTKYGLIHLPSGRLAASVTWSTDVHSMDQFIAALSKAISELTAAAEISRQAIDAIGIGIPGFIDGDFISLVWESMAYVEGTHFRPMVEAALGIPVRVDNDARIVALGEYYYGNHDRPNRLLSLTIGTGVGFALVVDGKLHEPKSLSHMAGHILVRQGASDCYCGQSGCLESLVNTKRLAATYQDLHQRNTTDALSAIEDPEKIFQAAAEGQMLADRAVRLMIDDLVAALNSYIYQYAPDVIVLGGGLSIGLKHYQQYIQAGLKSSPYQGYRVQIRFSGLGKTAGMFGAASLWI
jgi:glucokinase